ncbi:MAG: peptidyl-alpha-hydroxyglycine alpha-amidating lyase family protein [Pirellulaceae bacterium]|jgi:DNA-binding beta-propeller fold protein YncE|nr:peptidyl-alpha-hydroxyglycine alpha-amidating lyase family protein [Pirellulaceae bacterium]
MVTVGEGELLFEPVIDWTQLPSDVAIVEAVGVAVDSHDRVFVFNRGGPPVVVLSRDGQFLNAWGDGSFVRPHGIWIANDDTLYLTDDLGHRVQQFTADGELLRTIGPSGEPSTTGVEGFDYRKITHGAEPYNLPTNAIVMSDGEIFVADGYGNARIHHFSADGELLMSWGEPGVAEGQFCIPHGLGVDDRGVLYVADRENSRIQLFNRDGELQDIWTDVIRPCEVFIGRDQLVYIAELGGRAGLFPWLERNSHAIGGRLSIFNRRGELLSRWGGGNDPSSPCEFYAPHDICVDSQGSIYLSEVQLSAAKAMGDDASEWPTLRKFVPRSS